MKKLLILFLALTTLLLSYVVPTYAFGVEREIEVNPESIQWYYDAPYDYVYSSAILIDFNKIEDFQIEASSVTSSSSENMGFLFKELWIQVYKAAPDTSPYESMYLQLVNEIAPGDNLGVKKHIRLDVLEQAPEIIMYGFEQDNVDRYFKKYNDGNHYFQFFFKVDKSIPSYHSEAYHFVHSGYIENAAIYPMVVSNDGSIYDVNLSIYLDNELLKTEVTEVISGNTYQIQADIPEGYDFMFLIVDGQTTSHPENYEFTITNDTVIKAYYTSVSVPTDPEDYSSVSDLPSTTGSISKKTGTMGNVIVSRTGQTITLYITYNGVTRVLEPFTVASDTDLVPFNYNNAMYFTEDGQKYIVFNHHETKSTFNNTDGFIPYTVLNLNTFEWKFYDKITTRMYTDGSKGNVWTYFYVDQLVMDNLLSISIKFTYQYKYPLGITGDWIHYEKNYIEDEMTNITLPWYYKFFVYSLPYSLIAESKKFNEITALNPGELSAETLAKINSAYKNADPNFDTIQPELNLFRIFLGSFQSGLSTGINIYNNVNQPNDEKNLQVIEFTYMTDGKINTVKAKDIEVINSTGPNVTPSDETWYDKLWSLVQNIWHQLKYILIFGGLAFIAYKWKVFEKPKTTIIFAIIALLALIFLGII